MNRIAKPLIVFIVAAIFLPLLMSSCSAPKEEKFIGIQLWSVREAMNQDAEGTIAALGQMGYGFVEAAGYGNGKFYGMEPDAFRQLVEEHGMVFLSSHAGHDLPGPDNWDEVMAWWDECIDAHAAAGVKYIVQASMNSAGYESLEGLKAFCDYFNTVGEKCNAKGIRFGYHNHANEFNTLEGEVIYDFMLENTDPEKVFFQIDLYWVFVGNADPVDYFQRFPGRFDLWHVKDEAEVGASGEINFERIYQHADLAGFKYSIIEVEKYNYEPIESVRISLEYLLNAGYAK
jgi:sugar phosphate isomerase/epimerase